MSAHYYTDDHGSLGHVWWFRWLDCCRPGCSIVTVSVPGFVMDNFDAVTDDFGNLVRVP